MSMPPPPAQKLPGRTGGGFAIRASRTPAARLPPSLLKIFSAERDAGGLPYHEQHDPKMHTPQALATRAELRNHHAVVDALRRFAQLYHADEEGNVSRVEYARVHVHIVQALMGQHLTTEEQIREVIDEDWQSDAGGRDILARSRLFDALFEMTDLWCPSLAEEEYVAFLDALAHRISPALER